MFQLNSILVNLKTKKASLEGKDYLVAPVIMLREGVHNGSTGPFYYPPDEIQKSSLLWNGVPITLPHPKKDGNLVSANSPEMLANFKVGRIFNAVWEDGSLKAEAWIDIKKIEDAGLASLLDGIKIDQRLNVSTGLFSDQTEEAGEWNGEHYQGVVSNFRPDHLALLPDSNGACSWEDGCGIRANFSNKFSLDDHMNAVYNAISAMETKSTYFYVQEVFKDFVIYEKHERGSRAASELFQDGYSITDNKVTLTGQPKKVKRQVKFVPITLENKEEQQMNGKANEKCCPEKVQLLIENEATKYTEEDREWLETLSEEQIEKMTPEAPTGNEGVKPTSTPEEIAAAAAAGAGEGGVPIKDLVDANQQQQEKEPETEEQYIANAPEDMQDVLSEGLALHRKQKTDLIKALVANKNNTFTEDELSSMKLGRLKKLAQLAQVNNFAGSGGSLPIETDNEEEVLDLPVMNFEKK